VTIDGEQPSQTLGAEVAEPRYAQVREAQAGRDMWGWVQLAGLGLLAAGVAVLVVFALTLGGR
jgi:hypothetical protein